MSKKILVLLLGIFVGWALPLYADVFDSDIRTDYEVSDRNNESSVLTNFTDNFKEIFFVPTYGGQDELMGGFISIAFAVKNIFITLAVLFLIFLTIKFFLSSSSEEDLKKWRGSIIWLTIGIFFMQISFSIWRAFMGIESTSDGSGINSMLSWNFWNNIFAPLVGLLQLLASFAFIVMMIWAFYRIIFSSGDDEMLARGKRVLIYGAIGFIMIKLPLTIVSLIYGGVPDCADSSNLWSLSNPCSSTTSADLSGAVGFIGKIFTAINGFLTIFCVLLIIYTGVLVLFSGGDEEKLKKAKRNVIYIIIGFALLFASHAIFRFFVIDAP